MKKDFRFFILLFLFSLTAFGAGIVCYGRCEGALFYRPVSFARCDTVLQIATTYLGAYLRTAWTVLAVWLAGYTPYAKLTAFLVMALRSFPYGLAAASLYRGAAWRTYFCFLVFTLAVGVLHLLSCTVAYQFADPCDFRLSGTLGKTHSRQFSLRMLYLCGFLALVCAIWCSLSLVGLFQIS